MFSEFKSAFQQPGNAHVRLIIINVALFLVMAMVMVISTIAGFADFFKVFWRQFSLSPLLAEVAWHPWTLLTYAFTHSLSDIWHIVFNMLTLYWFGRLFVEYLGSDKLVAIYVLGALAGAVCYLILFNTIPYFERQAGSAMVGASGAIYAIMVAAATLLPDYTFFLLLLGPVRIKYIALFFIVVSFLGTVSANAGGNLAHLGGALMGFLYIKQLKSGRDWGRWITFLLQIRKPRIRVSHRKESGTTRNNPSNQEVSQAEIDAILDKISAGGYDSLSRQEKEKLFQAGKGRR